MGGTSHQISKVSIGPDGKLYVHVGEGHAGAAPQSLESYLGKVLRVNKDGSAPADNPHYDGAPITPKDYVYTRGKGFASPPARSARVRRRADKRRPSHERSRNLTAAPR